jgi:hypothetical protein
MSRAGRFTLIMAILTLGACLGPMLSILILFGGPWLIFAVITMALRPRIRP